MKLLTQLTAGQAVPLAQPIEGRGHLNTVHHEISPGCFIHLGLGPAGLSIWHGPEGVSIPMDALLDLASRHAPDLTAPEPHAAREEAARLAHEEMERRARMAAKRLIKTATPITPPTPS